MNELPCLRKTVAATQWPSLLRRTFKNKAGRVARRDSIQTRKDRCVDSGGASRGAPIDASRRLQNLILARHCMRRCRNGGGRRQDPNPHIS